MNDNAVGNVERVRAFVTACANGLRERDGRISEDGTLLTLYGMRLTIEDLRGLLSQVPKYETWGHLYYYPSQWGGYTVRTEHGEFNGTRSIASQPLYTLASESPTLPPLAPEGGWPKSETAQVHVSDGPRPGTVLDYATPHDGVIASGRNP